MKTQDICYWRGGNSISRDHVPPLNLFPKNMRKDLETVPASFEHNQKFTKLEERMRFYLQAGSEDEVALSEFDAKTMRSLEDVKAKGLVKRLFKGIRRIMLPGGESAEVRIEPSDYQLYFEKIARGLHYLERGQPFSGSECLIGFRQSFVATPAMVAFFNRFVPHFNLSPLLKIGKVARTLKSLDIGLSTQQIMEADIALRSLCSFIRVAKQSPFFTQKTPKRD